jgi:D-sedoheptulose 7-phosphate isomerase
MLGIDLDAHGYLVKLGAELARLNFDEIAGLSQSIFYCYQQGRCVFVFGNGGSALTASHFAEDLAKGTLTQDDLATLRRPRIRVVSLADNVGWITALANDLAYEEVFVQQLANLATAGDLAIAISGSGNSPNVLRAVEWANNNGLVTIGITGFDGGRLKQISQRGVHVPVNDMGMVEAIHGCILHWVVDDLFARLHKLGRYTS